MKRRLLIAILAVVMCLTCVFAACVDDSATEYTVNFETNGGSRVAAKKVSVLETEPETTREGYDFFGWYTTENFESGTEISYPFPVTKDITLYARWEALSAKPYKIRFETNGGSAVGDQTVTVLEASPSTSKTDYTFIGWFTTSDCSGSPVTFPYYPNAEITLYAGWLSNAAEKHNVTFDSKGGSAVSAQNTAVVETSPSTSREGYEFGGWFETADCSGNAVAFPYVVKKDVTLYAKWNVVSAKYAVQFDVHGGSAVAAQTVSVVTSSPVTTRSGYTFTGWYTSSDCSGNPVTFPYAVTGAITLHAGWLANDATKYKATFYVNGGTAVPAQETSIIQTSPNTRKDGSTFEGWYTNRDCTGSPVTFPYVLSANTDFYAKWKENEPERYTVTFNSNGGTEVAAQTVTDGQTIAAEPTPTKTNAEFLGWFERSDLLGTRVTFPYEPLDNVTLYAKWAPVQQTTADDIAKLRALLQDVDYDSFRAAYLMDINYQDNDNKFHTAYKATSTYSYDGDSFLSISPVQTSDGEWLIVNGNYVYARTYCFPREDNSFMIYQEDDAGTYVCDDGIATGKYVAESLRKDELESYFNMVYMAKISALDPTKFFAYDNKWYAMDDYVNEAAAKILGNTSGDPSKFTPTFTSFALQFNAEGFLTAVEAQSVVTQQSSLGGTGVALTYYYYTHTIAIDQIGLVNLVTESAFIQDQDRPSGLYPELDKDDVNRNNVTSDGVEYTTQQLKDALSGLTNIKTYFTQASKYYSVASYYYTYTQHTRGNVGKFNMKASDNSEVTCYYKYDDATKAFFLAIPSSSGYTIICNQYSYKNNYNYNQYLLGLDDAVSYNCVQPSPMLKLLANYAELFKYNENGYFEYGGSAEDMTALGKTIFGDLDVVYPEASETETYAYIRIYMNNGKVVKVLAASGLEDYSEWTEYFLKEVVIMDGEPDEVSVPEQILAQFIAPGEAKENGSTAALAAALTAEKADNHIYRDQFVYDDYDELGGVRGENSDTYRYSDNMVMITGDHYAYFVGGKPYLAYYSSGYKVYPIDIDLEAGDVEKYNEWISWIIPLNRLLNADWFYEGKDGKFYGKAENMSQLSKAVARFSGSENFLEGDAGMSGGFSDSYRWTVVLDYVSVSLSDGKLSEIYYSGSVHVKGIAGEHDKPFSGRGLFSGYGSVSLSLPSSVSATPDTTRPYELAEMLNYVKFSVADSSEITITPVLNATSYKMYVYELSRVDGKDVYTQVGEPFTVTNGYNIAANHPELIDQTAESKVYYVAVMACGDGYLDGPLSDKVQVEISKLPRVEKPQLEIVGDTKTLKITAQGNEGYHIEITNGVSGTAPSVYDISEQTLSLASLAEGFTYTISVYAKGDGAATRNSLTVTAKFTPYNEVHHITKLLSQVDFSKSFEVDFDSQSTSMYYMYDKVYLPEELFGLGSKIGENSANNCSLRFAYDKGTNKGKLLFVVYVKGGYSSNAKDNVRRVSYTFSVNNGKLVGTLKTTVGQEATVTTQDYEMNIPFKGLNTLDVNKFAEVEGNITNYAGLVYEYTDVSNAETQQLLKNVCFAQDLLGVDLTVTALRIHVCYNKNGEYDNRGGNCIVIIANDNHGNTYAFKYVLDSYGADLSQKVIQISD